MTIEEMDNEQLVKHYSEIVKAPDNYTSYEQSDVLDEILERMEKGSVS